MEKEQRIELYKEAIAKWGVHPQIRMVFEECSELMNALAKAYRGRSTKEDIITELADVSILCEQMALVFGYEDFEKEVEKKLDKLKKKLDDSNSNLLNQEDNFQKLIKDGNNYK